MEKKQKLFVIFAVVSTFLLTSITIVANAANDSSAETISTQEFTSSNAARLFQEGEYDRSIEAFDALLKNYPKDPLLIRYKAMALDQLGRSDEAVGILTDLLKDQPNHVPTHYFLGQAYARQGKFDQANKEWEWVIENAKESSYSFWAKSAIERFGKGAQEVRTVQAPKISRWNLLAEYGYEYDSNVILRPSDDSVADDRAQHAGRQTFDLGLRYRALSRKDTAFDVFYTMRQSAHDNSLDEFNFNSEEFGMNLRHRFNYDGRDYVANLRYDLLLGVLGDDFFSFKNRWTPSLETRFTRYTRTVLFDRLSYSQYGPDGFDPPVTSRDGLYNDVGVTHYWYTMDFTKYVYFRQEFNNSATRGKNFDSIGSTSRLGVFTPVLKRLDLETSTGLRLGFYPNFSSTSTLDTSRRRDLEWDVYTALTYHLTARLGLRFFYRYIGSRNQNNFFGYNRQLGGVHLIYDLNF